MVKIKLFPQETFYQETIRCERIEYNFDALVHRKGEGGEALPPFRDAESLHLLEANNIFFLENDWYSVMDNGKRCHMTDVY